MKYTAQRAGCWVGRQTGTIYHYTQGETVTGPAADFEGVLAGTLTPTPRKSRKARKQESED